MVCVRLDIMKGLVTLVGWTCSVCGVARQTTYAGRQGICRVSPLVLSPKAHLAERVAEACDGHPYMLWTSHEDRTWTLWKFTKHALIFSWLRSYGVAAAWLHMRNCSGTLTECCTKSENKLEGLWPLSDAHPRTMWTQDFVLKGLNAEGVSVVFGESVFVLLRSR